MNNYNLEPVEYWNGRFDLFMCFAVRREVFLLLLWTRKGQ